MTSPAEARLVGLGSGDSPPERADGSVDPNKSLPKTGVIYHEQMALHKCLWDKRYFEKPARLLESWRRCNELGLVKRCHRLEAKEADFEYLSTMHEHEYIKAIASSEEASLEKLREIAASCEDIFLNHHSWQAALYAAGCANRLIDSIVTGKIQNGMAFIRPPGHHAMSTEGSGYCLFNNIALAINDARKRHGLNKILIVDWDIHHGQGTQLFFENDPNVLYFSIHRYEYGNFWPNLRESDWDYIGQGKGIGATVNAPLNEIGCTPTDFLAIYHNVLMPIAFEFNPEIVIVAAGYDGAIGCPEGEMMAPPAMYGHLVTMLSSLANGRLALILEGGYCIKSLAESVAHSLRALLGDPPTPLAPLGVPRPVVIEVINNLRRVLRHRWSCFDVLHTPALSSDGLPNKKEPKVPFKPIQSRRSRKFTLTDDEYPWFPGYTDETARQNDLLLDSLIASTRLAVPPIRTCYVYDDLLLRHYGDDQYASRDLLDDMAHPERPERLTVIMDALERRGVLGKMTKIEIRKATLEEILTCHSQSHFESLKRTVSLSMREMKAQAARWDVCLNEHSFECGLLAAGGVVALVERVVLGECLNGMAVVRPPGHHAKSEEPYGFCLFNSVAMAAKVALDTHGLKKILIVDWDVHHGNGIQEMFYEDDRVLYISIHRYEGGRFFPGNKMADADHVGEGVGAGFNINIPWSKAGMGNPEYLAAFLHIVIPVAYQFNPELVIVSSGFDAAIGDPLGGCRVTPEMYGVMTQELSSLANGRIVLALEGGYSLNIIGECMAECGKVLTGTPPPSLGPIGAPRPGAAEDIRRVLGYIKEYWPGLAPLQTPLPGLSKDEMLKYYKTTCNDRSIENLKKADINLRSSRTCKMSKDKGGRQESGAGGEKFEIIFPVDTDVNGIEESLRALSLSNGIETVNGQIDGSVSGYVVPMETCPHLMNIRSPEEVKDEDDAREMPPLEGETSTTESRPIKIDGNEIRDLLDFRRPCVDCGLVGECWVCLTCYQVGCGRYVQGHSVKHGREIEGHQIALSFSDLSTWCYVCDGYIDNPVLNEVKSKAHIIKHGEPMRFASAL